MSQRDLTEIDVDQEPRAVDAMTHPELADFGRALGIDVFGQEQILAWEHPSFAGRRFGIEQLDLLALAMGEHLNHIRDEGRAAYRAAWRGERHNSSAEFVETLRGRAAGLLWSVQTTYQLLDKIGAAGPDEPVPFSQIDVVSAAIGLDSYERVARDHRAGMDKLTDGLVAAAPLLESFQEDFRRLAQNHHEVRTLFDTMEGSTARNPHTDGGMTLGNPNDNPEGNPNGNPNGGEEQAANGGGFGFYG